MDPRSEADYTQYPANACAAHAKPAPESRRYQGLGVVNVGACCVITDFRPAWQVPRQRRMQEAGRAREVARAECERAGASPHSAAQHALNRLHSLVTVAVPRYPDPCTSSAHTRESLNDG